MRPPVTVARALIAAGLVVAIAAPIRASAQRAAERPPVDSVDSVGAADGVRDAHVVAARRSVAGNATAGFFGGLAIGFFGAFALAEHGAGPGSGTVAGLAVLVAATEGGETVPASDFARRALERGPAYEHAFRTEHARRLRARRRRAGLVGALGGAGVGALAFGWVLGHVD